MPEAQKIAVLMPDTACLHCAVWSLMEQRAPKGVGGEPIYDAREIIANLMDVVAEVVASLPAADRRGWFDAVSTQMPALAAKAVRENRTLRARTFATAPGH